ncbi:unnamed protein product [Staurois parvus]|uniref:Uncharacterized protein n=1 Tax=Staurois parvus TaxID=386267 RepID=A0ABN9GQV0_9NEOB|nr:unnamed protein product [Staurois parvus]
MHTALDGCAQHRHTKQCDYSEAHGHSLQSNSKQHTVNPLIAPMLTPSCPVLLVQCQCFF